MDNKEEVLQLLEEFEQQKPKEIPRELEEYLKFVAKTGDPIFLWSKVKFLFQEKLEQVLCDYYESCPNNDLLQCPNVEQFNFDLMKNKIFEKLDTFASAPFTIQRLSELLTSPRKEYNRTDKFMRAVEKNILVVTTQEPGSGPRGECPVLNGLMDTSTNVEHNNVAKLADDLKCCLKEEEGSEEEEEEEEASDEEEMSDEDKTKVAECQTAQQNSSEIQVDTKKLESEPACSEDRQPCSLEQQPPEPCEDPDFVFETIVQDIEPPCPSIEETKQQNCDLAVEESVAKTEANISDVSTEVPVEALVSSKVDDQEVTKEIKETDEISEGCGSKEEDLKEVSCNVDAPADVAKDSVDTENDSPTDDVDVTKSTIDIENDASDTTTSTKENSIVPESTPSEPTLKRKETDTEQCAELDEDTPASKRQRVEVESEECKSEVETVSNGQ